MVEIILTVYLISFCCSISLLAWHFFSLRRQLNSKSMKTLNLNLQKVNRFWSCTRLEILPWSANCVEQDQAQAKKSVLWIGFLAFASVPGLFLLAAVILSIRYLNVNRFEQAIFQSALASNPELDANSVENLISQMSQPLRH